MSDPKSISHKYFTKCQDDPTKRECKCKKKITQRPKTGYSNLFHHIQTQHPDYQKESINQGTLPFAQVSKKSDNIYSWLKWVCCGMKPLEFVEDPSTREFTALEPITVNTLKKYLERVTKAVETKIENELPEKFALIIDGWTKNSTHFVGVFASFPASNENGYETVLLAFSPMFSETTFDASEHFNFISRFINCSR